ncbi:MAG: response regulator transcription factor [Christensenellales bacterium]|jgi:two-component system KDP operon response regulator KdpE
MTSNPLILVIEDDVFIHDLIAENLRSSNYRVLSAYEGREGLAMAVEQSPDVILLDLGLPDMDGLDIIRSLRTASQVPILVISARSHEGDKVEALDLGADDYVTKPFSPSELSARVRAALRRTGDREQQEIFTVGDLCIDMLNRRLTVNGKEVHLTQMEYRIMTLLARNAGKVMTYEAIMKNVWGPFHSMRDNQVLRVNMANIRRKIEENPAEPRYILTEVGVGYRMSAEDENA